MEVIKQEPKGASKQYGGNGDNMQTDLSFNEIKALIDYATAGSNLDIESMSLKGADATIDGIYYYQLDQEALQQTILDLKTHLMVSSGQ